MRLSMPYTVSTSHAVTEIAGAKPKCGVPPPSPQPKASACSSQANASSHCVDDRLSQEDAAAVTP